MASSFDQSSSQSVETACLVEESHQEKPKPRPAAKKKQVGFDCEFIERKPFQPDCPVCLLVLRQPHQVTCCGYGFCRVCIEQIQIGKKSCPTCNQKEFTVFPDLRLQRSLYAFHVWCSHKTEGCEWSGELSQLEKHLNESPKLDEQLVGCQFAEVECHHCCELFQRRYVTAHQIEKCIRRPFSCDYCGNYGADFEDVTTKHWPVCGFCCVPCPNECGVYPERQNLQHHVSKDCPLTVVNCDFYYAGCEVQLPRKSIPAHLAENLMPHVSLMAVYSQENDEQIAALKIETQVLKNTLTINELQIAQLNDEKELLKVELKEVQSSLQDLQSYTGPPIELTMTEFAKHKRDGDEWYSKPFYTHPCGYKMCLTVDANGQDDTKDTHVSVGVRLMHGKFDDRLQFPFNGKITIQLTNSQNKLHCTDTVDASIGDNDITSSRVTTEERASLGYSKSNFLPHSELDDVLQNDCLHFRVTRVTDVGQETQLERQCLAVDSRVCVPPSEFTMTDFVQRKAENDCWFSPSIYTHPRGYRMCLGVYANGRGDSKGTHVSVYVHLMKGEWDNYLKWPFRGDITIQLLNQIEGKGHEENTIPFTENAPDTYAGRVTTGKRAKGWGWPQFISHQALNYYVTKKCQYLKYDCLHFRIVKVKLK